MKKKLLIFILIFCLSTSFMSNSQRFNDIKEVKAAAFTLPLAIGFFSVCLNMLGVTYYKNGQGNLNGDLADFATSKNVSITNLLSPYANVVVDVGRKVAKFSSAQIYLCKEFISYLKNKNEISLVNRPTFDMQTYAIEVGGLTSCFRINDGDILRFYDNGNLGGSYRINTNTNNYVFCVFAYRSNAADGIWVRPYFFTTDHSSNFTLQSFSSGGGYVNKSWSYINSYSYLKYNNDLNFFIPDKISSSITSFVVNINGVNTSTLFYNLGINSDDYSRLNILIRERFNISSSNAEDSSSLSNNVNLTDYFFKDATVANDGSISNNVGDDVDDTKPAVIYVPQIIDKAIDNAKKRDSNAIAINEDDLIQAIDETAVGVINPDATDEEERVIAPPLDLDITEDLTQDDAIADTILEDLVIPEEDDPTIPDPEPPIIDVDLASKFPFSIFFDFVLIMEMFDSTPEAPSFNLGFNALNSDYVYNINLSQFDSVARILRLMELLAFISGLIFLTIQYIRGKE